MDSNQTRANQAKFRITLLIDSLANGGAQRQFVNLAKYLHSSGHYVHVVTYSPYSHHKQTLDDNQINQTLIKKKYKYDVLPVIKLRKLVTHHRSDFLIAFLRTPSLYAEIACFGRRKPILLVSERGGVQPPGLTYKDISAGIAHMFAQKIITNSHDYANALTNKLPFLRVKTVTIYNGVDEVFFKQGQAKVESLKSGLINHKKKTDFQFCVVAARPTADKGILLLIEAIRILNYKGISNFCIHWIGPIEDHYPLVPIAKQLIKKYKISEHWNWKGPVSPMHTEYRNYDALILPSLHEGVANVMCEAMAVGLPSIATRIADNEKILGNGKCGILCEPNNSMSLADSMGKFINLDRMQREILSASAFEHSQHLFSMSSFINKWENVMTEHTK